MILSAKRLRHGPVYRIFTPFAIWYGTPTPVWAARSNYSPTPSQLLVADVSGADVEPIAIANKQPWPSDLGPRVRCGLENQNYQPPYD